MYKVKASYSKIDFIVFCMYKIVQKRVWPGGGGQMEEFRTEIFVGAIKPMDQLILRKKRFFEPP